MHLVHFHDLLQYKPIKTDLTRDLRVLKLLLDVSLKKEKHYNHEKKTNHSDNCCYWGITENQHLSCSNCAFIKH